MAQLNETFEKPEFDWSAISVGDFRLDHSQNFFGEYSRLLPLSTHNPTNKDAPSSRSFPSLPLSPSFPIPFSIYHLPQLPANKENLNNENRQQIPKLKANEEHDEKVQLKEEVAQEPEPGPAAIPKEESFDNVESMPEAEAAGIALSNLRTQWSPTAAGTAGASSAAAAPVPKAYGFKDLYDCNRQQALWRQEEEDRQARQFRSRPMPNFKALHKRIEERVVVHRITVPMTPETVKYWQSCVERRRQAKRDQEAEEQRHPATRHKPFNLLCDQRVRDRRDFDSAAHERHLQKKKEVNK
ncbi:hypothetical protein KR054_008020 [Drosophila jambulina]|nr:hypothetical protein KR054_008020 [Drosophila jambulina]